MTSRPLARFETLECRRLFAAAVPTDVEQYMLELVNRARANPAAEAARLGIDLNEGLDPGTITTEAKQPLAMNENLIDAARQHSQWMLDQDVFAHAGAGDSDPGDRMEAAGYPFTGSWGWGENLAYRSQKPGTPPPVQTIAQEHADLFIDEGIPGRGHRINLMKDQFKEVGVGVAAGEFNTYNALMSTQDFAYRGGDSFLTGVAYTDTVTDDDFYTPGEGLGAVTITARREGDGAEFVTTTLPTGGYNLALPAGAYDVTASGGTLSAPIVHSDIEIGSRNIKQDWVPSAATPTPDPDPDPTPDPDSTIDPDPTPDEEPAPLPPAWGLLKGKLLHDVNGNGRKDARESGMAGMTVYVDENNDESFGPGEIEASMRSDGSYAIGGLEPGTHRVRVMTTEGWRVSVPAEPFQDVLIRTGRATKVKPLAVTQKTTVSGMVFHDANGNAQQDEGEAALRKRRVFADLNGDGLWTAPEPLAVADKLGRWSLGLNSGSYSIRVIGPAKFETTAPSDGVISVEVTEPGVLSGHLFGQRRIA